MKESLTIIFIFAVFFLLSVPKIHAFVVRPLGGTILVAPVAGVTCPGTTPGQFTIKPVNTASPGPYLVIFSGTKNIPTPGAYFKGKYFVSPVPICNSGNTPVPTFMIIPFQYQTTVK